MRIIIISAIAQNGVIGKANGEMPWHVKEEFKHFKDTTFGHPVVMGRKTFNTLGKPLKGRLNIVVTRQNDFLHQTDELKFFRTLEDAIDFLSVKNLEKIFVIGGGEIYRQAITFADEMILSFMKFSAEGEVHFPEINEQEWKKELIRNAEQFDVYKYVRKSV